MATPSDTTILPPAPPQIPRDRRIGGYTMNLKTVEKWAARLIGLEEMDLANKLYATQYINRHIKQYKARLRPVGETSNDYFMIVTQMAAFRGYKDMPSSEITQFVPGARENLAYDLLLSEGVAPEDIEFQTWLD